MFSVDVQHSVSHHCCTLTYIIVICRPIRHFKYYTVPSRISNTCVAVGVSQERIPENTILNGKRFDEENHALPEIK